MNEKSAAYERNDVRSAATSVRFLKTLTGTSAERDRDSTTANVASSATAPPKKIQGHPGPSVNSPLANTPTDADVPPIAPKIPSAQFLSRPSANVTARIDSADGATRAAPNPWNARAAISNPADSDRPATSEAPEKIANPTRRTRRLPRSTWMAGSATFTIATSRTTMNCAAQHRARISAFFGLRTSTGFLLLFWSYFFRASSERTLESADPDASG